MQLRYFIIFFIATIFLLRPCPVAAQQDTDYMRILTPFEGSDSAGSATYLQAIDFYTSLAARYKSIKMVAAGPTDTHYPLHVVYYCSDRNFDIDNWHETGKTIILINNGIHPGEPDGIDASMLLLRDVVMKKVYIPSNVVLAIIPVFNVGGCLNRNSTSRANQNGPLEYGFRGSAENLDLNRDFMKMDAKETQSLVHLIRTLDPDIFIDNHVSDGADYQHIMTLLATQHNKLGGLTGKYMQNKFVPHIYQDMKRKGYDLVPYVNDFSSTPDHGWREFIEPPRFGSGYVALWQTMAFVPETHMLKPFKDRVAATYQLMLSFIYTTARYADEIKTIRTADRKAILDKKEFPLEWKVDTTLSTPIQFKGYEAGYKPSKVSGLPRLYYDRSKPFTKQVPFYNHYSAANKVTAPIAYIIPQGWNEVIDRLKCNNVQMRTLTQDSIVSVTTYHIAKYETLPNPYEKHYLHRNISVTSQTEKIKLLKGDYIIMVNQLAKRYLIEALEPTAPDGFFAWNFFDAILQQKEYFSNYVFEDNAAKMLEENAELKKLLEDKKKADTSFAKNGDAQLDFIYRHSPYYEPVNMRYPVFRID